MNTTIAPLALIVPPPMAKTASRPTPGVLIWTGGERVNGVPALGFIPDLIGGVFSLIAGGEQRSHERALTEMTLRAEAESARLQAQAALEAARIQSGSQLDIARLQTASYEKGLDYAWRAEQERAATDRARAMIESDVANATLRTQRNVAIDAQATQLVANTQNGIFSLASVGMEQVGSVARQYPRSTMWGFVLLAGITLMAISPPKFGRKAQPVQT